MTKNNAGGKRDGSGRKSLGKKQFATRLLVECLDMLEAMHIKTGRTKVDIIECAIKEYYNSFEKDLTQSK